MCDRWLSSFFFSSSFLLFSVGPYIIEHRSKSSLDNISLSLLNLAHAEVMAAFAYLSILFPLHTSQLVISDLPGLGFHKMDLPMQQVNKEVKLNISPACLLGEFLVPPFHVIVCFYLLHENRPCGWGPHKTLDPCSWTYEQTFSHSSVANMFRGRKTCSGGTNGTAISFLR